MNDELLPVCRAGELAEPDPGPCWLVDRLWARSAVGFLAGCPKLGKSWLGLDLAVSVATGTACLDTFEVAEAGPVLIYMAEDHPSLVRQRLAGLCHHRGLRLEHIDVHVITAARVRLDLDCDRQRLARTVEQIGPRMLVLDPLVRLHHRNENDSGEVAELLAFLRELQRGYDVAVSVVHHMRKGGAARAGQALRGSGDFHAWTDSALYLTAARDRVLLSAEHRGAPAPDPFEIRLVSLPDGSATHLELIETSPRADHQQSTHSDVSLEERLTGELEVAGRALTRVELRKRLRVNNQRLGQALAELAGSGRITRCERGWRLVEPTLSVASR